ncbi:unnamed protein product [Notodromas monacha]|uniref:DNA excision repair protein ERCC-8 n=1 Tax=Notodromas monacha TaxID=399045 RepID=A0A7R9G9E3_9CRUS|nr:unnamed protein product [Notodromas monacha]CAG0913117.1 unnamed protein product [Notodromas monacha]
MFRSLYRREVGRITADIFEMNETERRVREDFHLSKFKDVEPVPDCLVLSMDVEMSEGRYLLSGSSAGALFIHDMRAQPAVPHTCKLLAVKNSCKPLSCVSWYPVDTGMFFSSSADGVFRIWDANRMKEVERIHVSLGALFQHHSPLSEVHHNLVAVAGSAPEVKIVDTRTGSMCQELRRGHGLSQVTSCQWSPRANCLLVTGGSDGSVTVWDVRSGKSRLGSIKRDSEKNAMKGRVQTLRFSSDGLNLVGYSECDDKIRVWDPLRFIPLETIRVSKAKQHQRFRSSALAIVPSANDELLFYPSGKVINISTMQSPTDDDAKSKTLSRLKMHFSDVTSLCFNPFENELYSAGGDSNVLVWSAYKHIIEDLNEGREERRLREENRGVRRQNDPPVPSIVDDEFDLGEDAWSDDD